MGSALVIHDVGAHCTLVAVLVVAECILVPGIACAQNDNLGVAVDHLRHDAGDEIQSLLVGQAGDEADHKFAFILLQSEAFLQSTLVLFLFLYRVGCVIARGQKRIFRAVPLLDIDAVNDAAQLPGVVAQMRIQFLPIEIRLDLSGVGVADGGDHIRVGQAALHKVGIVVALLQHIDVEQVIGQSGPVLDGRNAVDALEAEIVDCEHCLRAAYRGSGKQGLQINGHQGRLPVVAVDHIRDPVQIVQRCQRCLREEAVLGNIIHKIGVGIAGAEELLVVDEIVDDSVPDILHDSNIEGAAVCKEVHHECSTVDHLLLVLLGDALVARQNYLYIAVLLTECFGKREHNIAKSARFHKGIALRADKGNTAPRRKLFFFGLGHRYGFFHHHGCGFLCNLNRFFCLRGMLFRHRD